MKLPTTTRARRLEKESTALRSVAFAINNPSVIKTAA
jgi:hypothetical protein